MHIRMMFVQKIKFKLSHSSKRTGRQVIPFHWQVMCVFSPLCAFHICRERENQQSHSDKDI